jgi:hypothetical protein
LELELLIDGEKGAEVAVLALDLQDVLSVILGKIVVGSLELLQPDLLLMISLLHLP